VASASRLRGALARVAGCGGCNWQASDVQCSSMRKANRIELEEPKKNDRWTLTCSGYERRIVGVRENGLLA
jgi:hypothetical protein